MIFGRQVEGDAVVIAFNAGRDTQNITCDVDDYLPDGALDRLGQGCPHAFRTAPCATWRFPAPRGGVSRG